MSVQLPLSATGWQPPAANPMQAATVEPGPTNRVAAIEPTERHGSNAGSIQTRTAASQPGDKGAKASLFADEEEGFSFWDLLDVINPLQHIPVVNTIYRELTGDEIGAGARLLGSAMFGPIGLIAGALEVTLTQTTGDTLGGHMLAMLDSDEGEGVASDTMLASHAQEQASPQVMTAAEAGVLLPMVAAMPRSAPSSAAASMLQDTSSSSSMPMMLSGLAPGMATMVAAQNAATEEDKAPRQPGFMPLKRNEPSFMPLNTQGRGAMPLPNASTATAPSSTEEAPIVASAAMPTAFKQYDPEAIRRALEQQGLSEDIAIRSHPALANMLRTGDDNEDGV